MACRITLGLLVGLLSRVDSGSPSARRYPTLTAIESGRGYVALFGGEDASGALLGDLHLWDPPLGDWRTGSDAFVHPRDLRTLAPAESERAQSREYFDDRATGLPPPRRNHAACSAGALLFVFGGYGLSARDGYVARRVLNDVHVYDTSEGQLRWSGELSSLGRPPPRRWGHTLTRVGGGAGARCYVFGGSTVEGDAAQVDPTSKLLTASASTGLLNDVHYFECGAVAAAVAAAAGAERADSVARLQEGERVVTPRAGAVRSWAQGASLEWHSPAVRGSPPAPRAFFAAAASGSKLFVFGGEKELDGMACRRYNDLLVLETETHAWSRVSDGGFGWGGGSSTVASALTVPQPGSLQPATRAHQQLLPTGAGQLLLVGGVDGLYDKQGVPLLRHDVWSYDTSATGDAARWVGVKDPIAHGRVPTQLATNDALEPRTPDNSTTRIEHGVAVDPVRGRVHFFGGRLSVEGALLGALDVFALGASRLQWMERHT